MAGQIDIIIARKALKEIDSGITKIEKMNTEILELSKSVRKLNANLSAVTTPKGIEERLKKNAEAQLKIKGSVDKVIESETKLRIIREKGFAKFEQNISKERKLRESQVNKESALRDRLLSQQKKEVIQLEKARVAAIKYNSAYATLNRNYEKAKINLANLLAAETKNTRAIKIAQKEFDRLTVKVRKVDAATRNYTKNIGNYGSALKGSIGFVRQMVSAMGLMGGAFLAIQIIRNTVKRIRDFDKSIVTLSAILRINRKDLEGLEQTIIDVAGASIKTSNEVADLATKLATLGKSKEDIIDLLEPVNNLSIGLQATSEEAGELLIQTLNAFGKGSEEAGKFADIIAKMRTSTALDFERIKDSLGFLAPTARAAGVSFEKTGAILGTLVDNGIKAARAGRLMSTAFLRLAKDGKTLEDALNEINAAQERNATNLELLKIAGDLFGARAAALGLILADNTSKVANLTGEFERAKGSLKELVETQLESLDAKLKILDATWEKFIINVEKGDGALANFFKNAVSGTTKFITLIDSISEISTGFFDFFLNLQRAAQIGGAGAIAVEAFTKKIQEERIRLAKELVDLIDEEQRKTGFIIDKNRVLAEQLNKNTDQIKAYIKEIKDRIKAEEEAAAAADKINEVIGTSIESLQELITENQKLIKTTDDDTYRIKLLEENQLLAQQIKLMLQVRKFVPAIKVVSAGVSPLKGGTDAGIPELAGTGTPLGVDFETNMDSFLDDITDFVDTYGDQIGEAIDITNAFFDNRIERIQQDIDANNEFFANQIALAEGNEAEQVRLEAERQKRDAELQKKLSAEARKQFIINQGVAIATIAINTAVAISEASPNVLKIIAAAVLGAAQLLKVASTPVPKFKEGTKVPTVKDMLAITGDGGKNEPITKDGKLIGVSPDTPTLTYLPKGAEVHKDLDTFMMSKNYDLESINNAAVMTSIFNDGERLSSLQLADVFSDSLNKFNSKIENKIERGIKRGFKNININNETIINVDSHYNKTL